MEKLLRLKYIFSHSQIISALCLSSSSVVELVVFANRNIISTPDCAVRALSFLKVCNILIMLKTLFVVDKLVQAPQ